MRWKKASKIRERQMPKGTYRDWKEVVAEDCSHQCVYCAIPENSFGGPRNFHIDHYRPKSRFASLENELKNLLYACAICNGFKGDDWPGEPDGNHSIAAYPNPCDHDYNELVGVDLRSGLVQGRYLASRYVVERLYLNRPQLILERRAYGLVLVIDDLLRYFLVVLPQLQDAVEKGDPLASDFLARIAKKLAELHLLRNELGCIRPYASAQVKRPA